MLVVGSQYLYGTGIRLICRFTFRYLVPVSTNGLVTIRIDSDNFNQKKYFTIFSNWFMLVPVPVNFGDAIPVYIKAK